MLSACCCAKNVLEEEKLLDQEESLKNEIHHNQHGSSSSNSGSSTLMPAAASMASFSASAAPKKSILKRNSSEPAPATAPVQSPQPPYLQDELEEYRNSVGDSASSFRKSSASMFDRFSARLELISRQSRNSASNGVAGLASALRYSEDHGGSISSFRSSSGQQWSLPSSASYASSLSDRSTPPRVSSNSDRDSKNSMVAYDDSLHYIIDALFVFCPIAEWTAALYTGRLCPPQNKNANDIESLAPHFLCFSFMEACKRARELMFRSQSAGSEAVVLEIDNRWIKAPLVYTKIGGTNVAIIMGEINPSAVVCVHSLHKFFEALSTVSDQQQQQQKQQR